MRGKAPFQKICQAFSGITPAYAGKRTFSNFPRDSLEDHPRLCGEKSTCTRLADNKKGSPPPMRGKVSIVVELDFLVGITPAYAGKSLGHFFYAFIFWDHPRLCGEKQRSSVVILLLLGSPPPMRGKDLCTAKAQMRHRITPAYAGKRLAFTIFEFTERDHPRLCGEKRGKLEEKSTLQGSPPPMRGKAITVL